MPLPDDQQATLGRLRTRLNRDLRDRQVNRLRVPGFTSLRAYRQGQQRLIQLGIAVPEALRDFVTIVAWPGTYADAIVTRLRPQGFLLDGDNENATEKEMWRIWQANDLDTGIRMALSDMVGYGRGYLCCGTNTADPKTPLITVETPFQMVHEWSPYLRQVTAAARFYDDDTTGRLVRRATLYLPNETRWLVQGANGWDDDANPDEHNMGRVPVQPLVNRADTDDPYGRSELLPIIGLTDAAARALTNAQVATEVMSLPQRFAAGMTNADFKDPRTGQALTAWEAYFGSVWATANKDARFGQFTAADLANFKTIVGLYSQLVAGITGMPMRYLGQLSDNPPSADGIRADESRLVGTAEEKQMFADGPIEATMRTAAYIATQADDPRLLQLETWWRSAATPTLAQTADAAVKLYQAGLISKKQARLDMGYSLGQIRQMEEQDATEQVDPVLSRIADGLTSAAGLSA